MVVRHFLLIFLGFRIYLVWVFLLVALVFFFFMLVYLLVALCLVKWYSSFDVFCSSSDVCKELMSCCVLFAGIS